MASHGPAADPGSPELWTIGHSVHTAERFLAMLHAFRIARVVDVRTVPRSRRNPQFDTTLLPATLIAEAIGYTHRPDLGGLRRPLAHSPNDGWRNAAFRGFADYMQTEEFETAVQWLAGCARHERIAVMCAEAVPWRCHRSLIADALTVRGVRVCHIMGPAECRPHRLTAWARVAGERITYPR